nr:hypothetical protein [Microvirga mediterraneensis]
MIGRRLNGGDLAPARLDCTYNLFRRAECASLICAIPIDRPVPVFVSGQRWLFALSLHPMDCLPPGFLTKAASEAVRFNGFYLFHLTVEQWLEDSGRFPASDMEIRVHVRAILKQLRAT